MSKKDQGARRFGLPKAVHGGWTWDGALAALRENGFEEVALRFCPERDWSGSWGDNEGPAPEPKDPAKGRWFAIMLRPDGVLARLSSYQGGYPRGPEEMRKRGGEGEFDPYFQELNSLEVRAEIDLGPHFPREAGGSDNSWTGEGTWRVHADANAVTGSRDLRSTLKAWTAMGKLVPIDQWSGSSSWLDPQLFTDVPLSGGSMADFEAAKAAFGERVGRDLDAFLAALPKAVARVFERQSLIRDDPPHPSARKGSRAWNQYASRCLVALGLEKAPPGERERMLAWGEKVERAERREDPQADWGERALGSNFLHALAASDMEGGSPKEAQLAWLGAVGEEELEAMASERDALGRTPSGWAFAKKLESCDVWDYGAGMGLMGWMMSKGLGGAPGEWVEIACAALESRVEKPKRAGGWDKGALELLGWLSRQRPLDWAGDGGMERLEEAAQGLALGDWARAMRQRAQIDQAAREPSAARSNRL